MYSKTIFYQTRYLFDTEIQHAKITKTKQGRESIEDGSNNNETSPLRFPDDFQFQPDPKQFQTDPKRIQTVVPAALA